MRANDQLHQLIHSLTKNEKGYFKKMSGLGGQKNNYLRLFDAIHDQEKYDEAALKKKFVAQNFTKNFSMAKTYLTDAILRALRNYHAAESTDKQVDELIDNVRICFAKGLYELGRTSLKKGKTLAEKHDLFHQHLLLLQYEFSMTQHFQQDTAALLAERERISSWLAVHQQLLLQSSRILVLLRKFRASRTEEENAEVQAMLVQAQRYDDPALPLLLRHIARETMANCHAYTGDRKMAFELKRATLGMYESQPERIVVYPNRYLKLLGNVLALAAEIRELPAFDAIYLRLEKLFAYVPGLPSLKKEIEVRFGIVFHLLHDDTKAAAALGDKEREFILTAPELADGRRLELSYTIASAHFTANQPRPALRWIRALLDSPHIAAQPYRKKTGELFELILFYELDSIELLESRLTAIARKRTAVDPVEQSLYNLFWKCIENPGTDRASFFAHFREELEAHMKTPQHKQLVEMTDMLLWLDRVMEQKEFEV